MSAGFAKAQILLVASNIERIATSPTTYYDILRLQGYPSTASSTQATNPTKLNNPIASIYGIFTNIYIHLPYFTIENNQM